MFRWPLWNMLLFFFKTVYHWILRHGKIVVGNRCFRQTAYCRYRTIKAHSTCARREMVIIISLGLRFFQLVDNIFIKMSSLWQFLLVEIGKFWMLLKSDIIWNKRHREFLKRIEFAKKIIAMWRNTNCENSDAFWTLLVLISSKRTNAWDAFSQKTCRLKSF